MLLQCQSVDFLGKAKCISPESWGFYLHNEMKTDLGVWSCFVFFPKPQILQPFNRKKKRCFEWPCLKHHSSTRPNGTIVRRENSTSGCGSCGRHIMKKMIDVLWEVFQTSLPGRPCSYWVVPIKGTVDCLDWRIYKTRQSNMFDKQGPFSLCKHKPLLATCWECTCAQQTHCMQSDSQGLTRL